MMGTRLHDGLSAHFKRVRELQLGRKTDGHLAVLQRAVAALVIRHQFDCALEVLLVHHFRSCIPGREINCDSEISIKYKSNSIIY